MAENCYGKSLAVIGTAVALQLSENLNATQMNILGTLFNVIGDQLSLLAATAEAGGSDTENAASAESSQKKGTGPCGTPAEAAGKSSP